MNVEEMWTHIHDIISIAVDKYYHLNASEQAPTNVGRQFR